MERKEALEIEMKLLKGCEEAIGEGRELNEREQKFYEAFVAIQNLRKILK